MSDDFFSNDFFDDVNGSQQSMTPGLNTMPTVGVNKLLVVVFVIDCSKSMAGARIAAVNAALQELKFELNEIRDNNALDLKVAVMSFTSSVKWDVLLTPVDELDLKTIAIRPGYTEYGIAFRELNKMLTKEQFMAHVGKKAPPAIMFLTDGEPNDDYEDELNKLLKNGWFFNASRCAVLLGDAINNSEARKAVSRFVNDASSEIVTAEDSSMIMKKIKLATMHTIGGNPIANTTEDGKQSLDGIDIFGNNNTEGTNSSGGFGDDEFL